MPQPYSVAFVFCTGHSPLSHLHFLQEQSTSSTLCSLIFMSKSLCALDTSRGENRLLNSNHIIFNLVDEYIDVSKYAFHTFSRHVFSFQKLEIVFKSIPLCSQIIEAVSVSLNGCPVAALLKKPGLHSAQFRIGNRTSQSQ